MSATLEEMRWLHDGEVGVSSATIWSVLTRERMPYRSGYPDRPQDPDDFRRCVLLLDRFPGWRPRLGEVAEVYPAWTELVSAWPEVESLLREEIGPGLEKWLRAPRTYKRMKEIAALRCLCGGYRIGDAPPRHTVNACHGDAFYAGTLTPRASVEAKSNPEAASTANATPGHLFPAENDPKNGEAA